MMHEFLSANRAKLAQRCRVKLGQRVGRSATEDQLANGIPLFLEQLIGTLRVEQTDHPTKPEASLGPPEVQPRYRM